MKPGLLARPSMPANVMPVRFKWRLTALFFLLFAGTVGCYEFMKIIERERQTFDKNHPEAHRFAPWQSDSVHYVVAGNPNGIPVVLIHGSPGSWDAYAPLLNDSMLTSRFLMLAPDRPGFGRTRHGKAEPKLEQQAAAILAVITHAKLQQPVILLGHSWGGPIAVQFSAIYPEKTRAVVNIAGSMDPNLEKRRWYNHLASWRAVRWISPTDIVTSNDELWNAKSELQKLLPSWNAVPKIVTLQGLKDNLVPGENADFVDRLVPENRRKTSRIPDQGHFILWYRQDLVRQAIIDAADGW